MFLEISTHLKRVLTRRKKLINLIYKEAFIMKLVPLADRVVLKQLEAEETTKSGIVLPGAEKEKPQQAEVIAVGPGGVVDGKEVKMEVKKGDNVIYSKYSGTEVKLDDVTYIIVKQSDILAIIK
jgi:chaperonin GroES